MQNIFYFSFEDRDFVREKVPTVMKNFMKAKGERCQKGLVVTKDFMRKKCFDFGEIYFIPLSLLVLGI